MIHLTTYIFEKCEVWTFQRRAGRPHRVSRKDFPSLGRKVSQYTTKSFIFWRPSFLQKCIFFSFFVEISVLTLKKCQTTILNWKTRKSWPKNKILWLSDENSRKKSQVREYPQYGGHFRKADESRINSWYFTVNLCQNRILWVTN